MILRCLAQGSFPILFAYHKKTDSRVALKFSPSIVDIDSIIDVCIQYGGSSVTHHVESWGGPHDLLHLFNTILVVHNSTPSILSEHDHRAVAAALMSRQNCTFCVSDLEIDFHGAASSVGDRNITFNAVMLQRFTQHTPNSCCSVLSLKELTSHSPLSTWTQHFQSQQLVSHLDIQQRKAPLLWCDQVSHECVLAPDSPAYLKKLSPTDMAIPSNPLSLARLNAKTHELLDPL